MKYLSMLIVSVCERNLETPIISFVMGFIGEFMSSLRYTVLPSMSIITRDMAPGPASRGVASGTIPTSVAVDLPPEEGGLLLVLPCSIS